MGGQRNNKPGSRTDRGIAPAEVERRIARLATRQHGAVTRSQLIELGLTRRVIDGRRARGALRPVHRGVYLVGPVELPLARPMAAALACAPRAYISHRSAASLWRIAPFSADLSPIELSVSGRDPGRKPGLRIHRVSPFAADEITILDGIPVTTVARTVLDFAATSARRELEQAVREAWTVSRGLRPQLLGLIARHPRHRGARPLRSLLKLDRDSGRVRSEAERRLRELIDRARLPPPEQNVHLHGFEVDFLWRAAGLVVEVDGLAYHSSGWAIRRDRRKEAVLAEHGFEVIRLIWEQIADQPEATIARIAARLALDGA